MYIVVVGVFQIFSEIREIFFKAFLRIYIPGPVGLAGVSLHIQDCLALVKF